MENKLHVDAWTDCNLWCHSQTANYRIVKCSGKWLVTKEYRPGREWKFISNREFETASEAMQELETMLNVKTA